MSSGEQRFVLTRPFGGFNDMLCQLETAWRYCERYGRVMVLDSSDAGMLDDLTRYYSVLPAFRDRIVTLADVGWTVTAGADATDCVDSAGTSVFARAWGRDARVDLAVDLADRVVLHASSGGGDLGVHFLEKLVLRDEVKAHLAERIAPLGGGYTALHIRNTDWETDYVSAFAAARRQIKGRKVLVCSDDSRALQYFDETYGGMCRFHTTSGLNNVDGRPLHYAEGRDVYQTNLEMLTDVYALAMGRRICMVDTYGTKRSGFAVLAAHMLRRIHPLGAANAFDLGPRVPNYLRSLMGGTMFRVFRVREIRPAPDAKHFCHVTYE